MNTQLLLDKGSIALSVACGVHCLALPVITVMSPALIGYAIADEVFHQWLAFAVLPLSVVALTMGCRQHRRASVVLTGLAGLLIILLTVMFGHDVLGETGEKIATVIGASTIAIAHFRNYRLCQQQHECGS